MADRSFESQIHSDFLSQLQVAVQHCNILSSIRLGIVTRFGAFSQDHLARSPEETTPRKNEPKFTENRPPKSLKKTKSLKFQKFLGNSVPATLRAKRRPLSAEFSHFLGWRRGQGGSEFLCFFSLKKWPAKLKFARICTKGARSVFI